MIIRCVFLEISIKNNSYWIDWNIIIDKDGKEVSKDNKINIDHINNKNILCIENNNYCYYNRINNLIYNFNYNYKIISIDGSNLLDTLPNLEKSYNKLLYEVDFNKKNVNLII